MSSMLYEMIGRIFSRAQMKRLGALLESAGLNFIPEAFAGFLVVLSFILSLLSYILLISFPPTKGFLFKLSFFISYDLAVQSQLFVNIVSAIFSTTLSVGLLLLFVYVFLLLRAEKRKREVESVLPEFLSLAASNVRAGMTVDQALWYAAKPEFGILSQEVSILAKKTFGGMPFNQSIDYLSERFNSKSIRRVVALIKQGIASGGQMAEILERTAEDSRQMQVIQKEIAASLLMYTIFILFAGALGAPFLFAVAGKLIGILEGVFAVLPSSSSVTNLVRTPFFVVSPSSISSSDFFVFAILSCAITSVFSSLIIGVISKGSKKEGISYIPFILFVSLTVFYIVSGALDSVLSNLYL
ncbi:MAG: type II secretion system F family protein [Candidatus Micrarchaeota archaeon]|nr:type II secretion system F family protein [Candidatus Micrarchaeota archaeon]